MLFVFVASAGGTTFSIRLPMGKQNVSVLSETKQNPELAYSTVSLSSNSCQAFLWLDKDEVGTRLSESYHLYPNGINTQNLVYTEGRIYKNTLVILRACGVSIFLAGDCYGTFDVC